MVMDAWTSQLFLIGYPAVYVGAVLGLALWRRQNRRERKPFADEQKLLRGPGETLRRRVAEMDENLDLWLLGGSLLPLVLGPVLMGGVLWCDAQAAGWALALGGLGMLGGFFLSSRWILRRLAERQNRYLGYFGERVVAEALEPLKLRGWRIFHDVPCTTAGAPCNIDHVAIGPGGVFAIETKTRRKGRVRPGQPDYQVGFDGQRLVWPWGEDRHGLEQAHRQAVWLEKWLESLLGRACPVSPILTLPGWWVERTGRGVVQVLNVRELPAALTPPAGAAPLLTGAELDLLARQLDAVCRDVAY